MKSKSGIRKNLGYQTIYQVLNTCLPLITAPYLARVLGATQQGIYSYTASIVAYFVLFAKLGTANYGTRSIADKRDNVEERSKVFWEIFFLELLLSVFTMLLYFLYVIAICRDNKLIALIQCFELVACMVNINWLFFGLEKFKITTTRSIIIRILTVIMILLFVKDSNDLWIYALIMTLSNVLNMCVLWYYVPKFILKMKIDMFGIWRHFKPNLMLFIPLLAMSVYHIMDKTMLGLLSNYTESGYYYNADKIVNIPVGLIDGISTVMLPRMSYLIGVNQTKEADSLFKNSLELTVLAGTAMSFGIAAIANEFEPIFFGPGFDACIMLTIVLAPVLIIKSFSFTIRYQYLIPRHEEKDYTISVVAGAITNFLANLALIPNLGALGAVLGTLMAEFVACVLQFISLNKYIKMGHTLMNCLVYVFFGVVMFGVVRLVATISMSIVFKLFIEIILGAISFIILCLIYWKSTNSKMKDIIINASKRKLD